MRDAGQPDWESSPLAGALLEAVGKRCGGTGTPSISQVRIAGRGPGSTHLAAVRLRRHPGKPAPSQIQIRQLFAPLLRQDTVGTARLRDITRAHSESRASSRRGFVKLFAGIWDFTRAGSDGGGATIGLAAGEAQQGECQWSRNAPLSTPPSKSAKFRGGVSPRVARVSKGLRVPRRGRTAPPSRVSRG